MHPLERLNALPSAEARQAFFQCCGCNAWAEAMTAARPFSAPAQIFDRAEVFWAATPDEARREIFTHHPRIGDLNAWRAKFAGPEQAGVQGADEVTLQQLADGNRAYEKKFGHLFLICATGKSADEMLAALKRRLENDPQQELAIAWSEQAKISRLRLEKLLKEDQ